MERTHAWLDALRARAIRGDPGRAGVVYPLSAESLRAAVDAHAGGCVSAVLYGPRESLLRLADANGIALDGLEIVDGPQDPVACARQAVADAAASRIGLLVKGSLHTDELLGAVVARDAGLRTSRRMSHVFVFDVPAYHKPLAISDAVVNIAPDLKAKRDIVENAIAALRGLGIERPKVAAVAATETVNPAVPATLDARALREMAERGGFEGAIVDGPFGFDNAISREAARIKGIDSPVAGDPDLILVPDLNTGNTLYKSLVYLAGAECAGVVLGAAVPVVLTSRADSVYSRTASCALASVLSRAMAATGAPAAPAGPALD